jgi:hypothetical protein
MVRDSSGDDPALANSVEAKVKDLDAQLGNAMVSCESFTFSSVDNCEAFMLEHVPGNTYTCSSMSLAILTPISTT